MNKIKKSYENFPLIVAIVFCSFLTACASNVGFSVANSNATSSENYQSIRPLAVGQQWVYDVRNLYNNDVIDRITETVVSITPVIEIKRESQKHGLLVSEIQSTKGLVLRDPYWDPAVNFISPMPMWPQSNQGTQTFTTQYKVGEDNISTYSWSSTITPLGSELITVGGKQFNALKSSDSIFFISQDFSRHTSSRNSTIWLAPNVGRWVIRQTRGSYLDINTGIGNDRYESMLQYELVSFK
jgi:hypothetical protein